MSSKDVATLLNRREKVITEIVSTENSFNSSLQIFKNLCTLKIEKQNITLKNPKLLELFKSLSNVQESSQKFVEKLHITVVKKTQDYSVADAFVDFSNVIKDYFDYIYLYHQTISLLSTERQTNPAFAQILSKMETNYNDTT